MQCIPRSYQPGTISSPKVRLHYCRQRFAQLCKSIKPTSVLKRQNSARHLSLITTCRQDRWEPIPHQRPIRLGKTPPPHKSKSTNQNPPPTQQPQPSAAASQHRLSAEELCPQHRNRRRSREKTAPTGRRRCSTLPLPHAPFYVGASRCHPHSGSRFTPRMTSHA